MWKLGTKGSKDLKWDWFNNRGVCQVERAAGVTSIQDFYSKVTVICKSAIPNWGR